MEDAPRSSDDPVPVLTSKQLNDSIYELGDAIIAKYGGHYTQSGFLPQWFDKGTECLQSGTMSQLDCPDTLYPLSANAFRAAGCAALPQFVDALSDYAEGCANSIENIDGYDMSCAELQQELNEVCDNGHLATIDGQGRDFYVVFGVNHKANNRSRYSSVTLYYYKTLSGITAHSSEDGYEGSAQYYLGDDHVAAPYLYARAYARDCAAQGLDPEFCYDIPSTSEEANGSTFVPIGGEVMWITRMYDHPDMHAGPLTDQTLMDVVLHFTEEEDESERMIRELLREFASSSRRARQLYDEYF